ncbi:hypothetical protein R3X27_16660 [Tropicimonas sp. TH_r6]|uniref:hypothetical protein n=1 Tax=Tropicimonas sp. TH_r6 TaxID=3082085 RepID=UPI00295340C8|nr:hypothetical protein [Tropicimonas sp. TH_r6]MDV7144315.1 hypothetical protein [Tropicimonas sp. TH_r6]
MKSETGKVGRRALRLGALIWAMAAASAFAQEDSGSAASANADANNPLANVTAFNIQTYHIGSFHGLPDDVNGNQYWLRFAKPLSFGNSNWLLRASLPYNSFPLGSEFGDVGGVGDLDVFLAYQIDTQPGISFGIGPQIVAPTATDDRLGAEQWQLGLANVFFDGRSPKFQYGYLAIYRAGIGDTPEGKTRPNLGAFQPFAFLQLGDGWYTGGAPVWTYNFSNDNYNVPLGLRAGKVVKFGKTTANIFIEPQWSVAHRGDGQPEFQVYAAINLQFR